NQSGQGGRTGRPVGPGRAAALLPQTIRRTGKGRVAVRPSHRVRSADRCRVGCGGRRMNERIDRCAAHPRRSRMRLVATVVVRGVSVLYLLSTLLQPVLAGLFVTGDVDMLTWHELNAHANLFLAAVLFVATILLWRPARGPAWPMAVTAALLVLVQTQAGLGYARQLAV